MTHHDHTAGHLYCAISALSFLDRLPPSVPSSRTSNLKNKVTGLSCLEGTVRWLVSRQIETIPDDDDDDDEADRTNEHGHHHTAATAHLTDGMNCLSFHGPRSAIHHQDQGNEPEHHHQAHHTPPVPLQPHTSLIDIPPHGHFPTDPLRRGDPASLLIPANIPSQTETGATATAGFNGRCNKAVDTCYSFWVCGSLSVCFIFSSPTLHLCPSLPLSTCLYIHEYQG